MGKYWAYYNKISITYDNIVNMRDANSLETNVAGRGATLTTQFRAARRRPAAASPKHNVFSKIRNQTGISVVLHKIFKQMCDLLSHWNNQIGH